MDDKLYSGLEQESYPLPAPAYYERTSAYTSRPVNEILPDEMALMKLSVILPMVRSITQQNKQQLEARGRSLRRLFIRTFDLLTSLIERDLSTARQALRTANISLQEDTRCNGTITYRYLCRGFEDTFTINRDYVRSEVSTRISHYIAEIFKDKS